MADTRWIDPEIDRILDADPELIELANRVRAARPDPGMDPRFQAVLRAQLMREAPAALGAAAKPVRQRAVRRERRGWWRHSTPFAWGGASLGVALAAAAVLIVLNTHIQDHQVTAMSPVAERHAVSPNNVITVAFSQPMNEAAVVAGLHIRPATEVSTSWQGNNLLINPTHHLASNTPYTVTIDHSAAQAADGELAQADILISFGTAPTPPSPPAVAQLAPQTLGAVNSGTALLSGGDGTLVATSAPLAPAAASPSPSAASSASASPSGAATANPGAGSAATTPAELAALHSGSTAVDLGPAAGSAALAPNGLELIAAVPTSSGTKIVLVALDGSQRTVLTSLAVPVLATGWLTPDTAVVAEPDRIVTVDLQGHVHTLTTLPAGTDSVRFARSGGQAFAGAPDRDGSLIDLTTLQTRTLPGSREIAAFTGDGSTVAWVDNSGAGSRLVTSPVSHDASVTVPLNQATDRVTEIALDSDGSLLTVVDHPATGNPQLDVLALPSGSVVARAPAATNPVFTAADDAIAYVAGGQAQLAPLPGGSAAGAGKLPDGSSGALQAFIDAQIHGDRTALGSLSAAGVSAAAATPTSLTRAYVISAVATPDGTVAATARLIIDPSATHAVATFADETLQLSPATNHGGYLVSSLTVGPLHDEPVGPHITQVLSAVSGGHLVVLHVAFDSDLNPASVASAITVTNRAGIQLPATVTYDANTRTATVIVGVPATTPVTLGVATTLVDVDGQALAAPFRAAAGG